MIGAGKMKQYSNVLDRPLGKGKQEVSLSAFAFLFSELVQYNQTQVDNIAELERRLEDAGYAVGARVLELLCHREKGNRRETRLLGILSFIHSTVWKVLFGKVADSLEKGTEHEDEYMISEKELLVNRFISIPKDMGAFNCGAFVAGIVRGVLDNAGFPAVVTAHFVPVDGQQRPRTTILIKFAEELPAGCDDITTDVIIANPAFSLLQRLLAQQLIFLHLLIMMMSPIKSSSMVHLDVPAGSLLMFQLVHLPSLALAADSYRSSWFTMLQLAFLSSSTFEISSAVDIQLWTSKQIKAQIFILLLLPMCLSPRLAPGIQLAVVPQPLWLRNHNPGLAHRIMVKRLATSPHDPLGITDSACKNQLIAVSVQYGPFNPYIPIRSTTIGKSRVAKDPIAMHTSWRLNSDIASVTSIGYPRMSASGESSTTMHRLPHASGSHPIPPPDDPKTNQYNQDLGLIHSTNGNHLESPNKGSSIDHQVTIYLHAQNITMFPTNEIWYFAS
ncbi:trafficking protein particle complex subunit 5 [Dorcoceras hygrometricum]|uniref:Trafficking protein particle complex subunit 5 n=1 Tax=Dorcoceras hygrometricum TaxID=472368 RepID=A0A2Z7DB80_9LAMI|nr:trafficking protein particle complex subunit 5 [Dorcoceras hygrometricum]